MTVTRLVETIHTVDHGGTLVRCRGCGAQVFVVDLGAGCPRCDGGKGTRPREHRLVLRPVAAPVPTAPLPSPSAVRSPVPETEPKEGAWAPEPAPPPAAPASPPARERIILAPRDTYGMTLEEVGNRVGVTRERVRQIEVRALEKLRRNMSKAGLSFEDLLADPPQEVAR